MYNFYESDDLIISGQLDQFTLSPEWVEKTIYFADITFTLRVNGKLIQHKVSYQLAPDEASQNEYTFKDWTHINNDISWLIDMKYLPEDYANKEMRMNITKFIAEINKHI